MLKELVEKLLDDDDGISERAYTALLGYLNELGETELLKDVSYRAEACDGRFYFPSS